MNCSKCNYPVHTNATGVCKNCRKPLAKEAEVVVAVENEIPVALKPKKKSKAKSNSK
jgi:predicted amidophosphoribosyltransferase